MTRIICALLSLAVWQGLAQVDDGSAFVQVALSADPVSAVETKAGWPDIDGIVDSVKDKAGDILESATTKLVSAMEAVADGMNEALNITENKITELKNHIHTAKKEVVAKCDLNDNGALQNLKKNVDGYLETTQKEWAPFLVALQGIERAIMEAVQLAGEPELAQRINTTLTGASERLEAFIATCETAKDVAFDNTALEINATRKAGEAYVRTVEDVLSSAKVDLKKFQEQFTEAFKELERAMDKHVAGLLEPDQAATVHEAFNGVTQNAEKLGSDVASVEDDILMAFEGEQWPGSILGLEEKSGSNQLRLGLGAMVVAFGFSQL